MDNPSLFDLDLSLLVYLIIGILFVAFVLHALWVFTRGLGGPIEPDLDDKQKATIHNVRWIIGYGYLSIILILAAVIALPIMVPEFPDPFPSDKSPIQILTTCTGGDREEGVLVCPPEQRQWTLNIGGVTNTRTVTLADVDQEDAKRAVQAALDAAGKKLQSAIQEASNLSDADKNSIVKAAAGIQSVVSPLEPKITMQDPFVSGGLTVPLYMIIIAIFGGCIAMTRRIPEYQARGAPGWEAYYQKNKSLVAKLKPPLDGVRVREYVVFQIMQTVFAPFLAVVAFAAFQPKDVAGVVAIGFISGFASEPILIQIRKVADAVSGASAGDETTKESQAGSDATPAKPPKVTGLEPDNVKVKTGDLTVKVVGEGFSADAKVHVDGKQRATSFKTENEITFELEQDDIAAPADKTITVVDSGGETDPLTLKVVP